MNFQSGIINRTSWVKYSNSGRVMSLVKIISIEDLLKFIGGEKVYTVHLGHIREELGYYYEKRERQSIGEDKVSQHLILWSDKGKDCYEEKNLANLKAKCFKEVQSAEYRYSKILEILSTKPPEGGMSLINRLKEHKSYRFCMWLMGIDRNSFETQLNKFKLAHDLISEIPFNEVQILSLPDSLNISNVEVGKELIVVRDDFKVNDRNWAQKGVVKSVELHKAIDYKSTGVYLKVVIKIDQNEEMSFVFHPEIGQCDDEYSVDGGYNNKTRVFSNREAAINAINSIRHEFDTNMEEVKKNLA